MNVDQGDFCFTSGCESAASFKYINWNKITELDFKQICKQFSESMIDINSLKSIRRSNIGCQDEQHKYEINLIYKKVIDSLKAFLDHLLLGKPWSKNSKVPLDEIGE